MKPALVIMAAGMGSRYGGMKQIDPVDDQGHIIIDYSVYDAYRAGFRKVVFIIKEQNRADFEETIGRRIGDKMQVEYVYQKLEDLPEGFSVPEGRVKPWGTAHAILSARDVVKEPFAVINADDYYGIKAFQEIYNYLEQAQDDDKYRYCMVGYRLYNTLTENGSVGRGVCEVSPAGELISVTERTKIYKRGEDAAFTEDDGQTFTDLPGSTIVSMNLWGFSAGLIDQLWARFGAFLDKNLPVNPLKCEYFLPFVVDEQIRDGSASVSVLPCEETWYGVTYREDLASVQNAIAEMKAKGIYKEDLWA